MMSKLKYLAWLVFAAGPGGVGCMEAVRHETIAGPEAEDLADVAHGTIVYDKPVGGIVALSFPSGEESIIRRSLESAAAIHAIGGPDRFERIVVIENHDSEYMLRVIQNDKDDIVFVRRGDALWDARVGSFLSLSESSSLVGFVVDLCLVENVGRFRDAGLLVKRGTLAVWDIEKRRRLDVSVMASDLGLSWSPDGRSIYYVDLIPARDLNAISRGLTLSQSGFEGWGNVPAVYLLDVEAGVSQFCTIGFNPVAMPDGRLLVAGAEQEVFSVNLSNGDIVQSDLPGLRYSGASTSSKVLGMVGSLESEHVLYWGVPTEGQETRMTVANSPLVGPKPMLTLKVGELDTGRFATLVPFVDPRREVSVGPRGQFLR